MKPPHKYYQESKHAPPIKGLRWAPDPRVLQPEILRSLVREPAGPELVKEKVSGMPRDDEGGQRLTLRCETRH